MTEKPSTLTFEPPGPGTWMLDTTHNGRRPVSRYMQDLYLENFSKGMGQLVARYGLPIKEFQAILVHGCLYVRPVGVGEPANPRRDPPAFVMWLAARMHPELRSRNRIATQAWAERHWREDVDRWFATERAAAIDADLALQEFQLTALDDQALAAHIEAAGRNLGQQLLARMAGHGGVFIPVGDYLAHCNEWGIAPADAARLLRGASPATVETAMIQQPVGEAIAAATSTPSSVDRYEPSDPPPNEPSQSGPGSTPIASSPAATLTGSSWPNGRICNYEPCSPQANTYRQPTNRMSSLPASGYRRTNGRSSTPS